MPKIPFWIFILLAILYFSAARVDIMDIDATQYAQMSKEMAETGSFLQVFEHGRDYLDKPPFLFWVSALSMKLFGFNNFGYKFPSILFALWALYATYRLARLLYDESTARLAALVLGICQGMFLMTNDVRTDTILMGWVITAIWAIKECDIKRRWGYVLLGTFSIACGMMTKGPIALLVPVFCFGTDWLLKREWKKIFSSYHLVDLLLIAIFLIPMSIGLYQQFDVHPEKTVNGMTGVSGLRFFYWSQSFGRITGESPWNNGATFEFLAVNMLWSFLPWMFLFLVALARNIMVLFRQKFRLQPHQEFITTGGFILAYFALGSSRYQLPHYIFVVFPLASIIVAVLMRDLFSGHAPKLCTILRPIQYVLYLMTYVAVLLVVIVVFPGNLLYMGIWLAGFIIGLYLLFSQRIQHKILWTGACAMIVANIILTHHFYFTLLQYQLGSQAGRVIREQHLPPKSVTNFRLEVPSAIHFYAGELIDVNDSLNQLSNYTYIVTGTEGKAAIDSAGYKYIVYSKGDYFNVTRLSKTFLDPSTRNTVLRNYFILKMGS